MYNWVYIGFYQEYTHHLGYITGCLGYLLGMKPYPDIWGIISQAMK